MKQSRTRRVQCTLFLLLSMILFLEILIPAIQIQASAATISLDGSPPLEQNPTAQASVGELLLRREKMPYQVPTGQSNVTTLRDGDSINSVFEGERYTVCVGNVNNPVPRQEVTVQLLSQSGRKPVPPGAVEFVSCDKNYADYRVALNRDSQQASAYFGSISPDFGFDLLITSGEQSLCVHVKNEGVQIEENISQGVIRMESPDRYRMDGLNLQVSGDVLNIFSPTLDWIGRDFALTGEIAEYFTLGEAVSESIWLTATKKMEHLPDGQTVSGELTWIGKLDGGQTHTIPVEFQNLGWMGSWHKNQMLGWWDRCDSEVLRCYEKGNFQLRLYPGSVNINDKDAIEPITLTPDVLQKDLPSGITVSLLEDQSTLLVEYDLKKEDVRETPYQIRVDLPGMKSPAVLEIRVIPGAEYMLVEQMYRNGFYQKVRVAEPSLKTLLEDVVLLPLVDGIPTATRQQLEMCELSLKDAQSPNALQTRPVEIFYQDENNQRHTCWGLAIMPVVQVSEAMQKSQMLIQRGDSIIDTVRYSLQGMDQSWNDAVLKSDCIERRVIRQIAEKGRKRYSVQTADGLPMILTEKPVISGSAAGNIRVVWDKGLSGIRVDFNSVQVPGQAIVEMRAGSEVRRLVFDFLPFAQTGHYVSLGSDYLNRSYWQDIQLTENLAEVSVGGGQTINPIRFIEDGSFNMYLWSRQYIGHENHLDMDSLTIQPSFATELVKKVTYTSSDQDVLRIGSEITSTNETDPVFDGNGYANPEGNCFGVQLIPGGKTGTCDVIATIELNIPSKNDPFGCDTTQTSPVMSIGCTFTVNSADSIQTVYADADTLQNVLDSIVLGPVPTKVLLKGGSYPMDLELMGKNIILQSEDPNDPAVFTGNPDAQGGYIITVQPASSSFELKSIVVDGGGVRGGIENKTNYPSNLVPLNIRDCIVKNCTIGIYGDTYQYCKVRNSMLQNCEIATYGCLLHACMVKDSEIAMAQNDSRQQKSYARWTSFIANDVDLEIYTQMTGSPVITIQMPQNYWNGRSAPTISVLNAENRQPLPGKMLQLYTSPYYVNAERTKLNVDLATTQLVDDNTLLLPLEKGEAGTGSMLVQCDAFAMIQKSGKAAQFPIYNKGNKWIAQWDFQEITRTDIDTDLNVEDCLSKQAQQAVDLLPQEDKDKIQQEVNLSHNGYLSGPATIRIKASERPTGNLDELHLYWIKADGTIVPAEVVQVQYDAAEKCYIIVIYHCSEYIITSGSLTGVPIDSNIPTNPNQPVQPDLPIEQNQLIQSIGPNQTNRLDPTMQFGYPSAGVWSAVLPAQSHLYSAQQVIDAFKAQTGDVTLNLRDTVRLSQKAFELLKKRPDNILELKGDGYTWRFRGSTIKDFVLPSGVFDTSVMMHISKAQVNRITAFAGDRPWYAFETAYSGALPGAAELEIMVDAVAIQGMHCTLYCLLEEGDITEIASVDVAPDGKVILPLVHCSVYFLMADGPMDTNNTTAETTTSPIPEKLAEGNKPPRTAEDVNAGIYVILAAVVTVIMASLVWSFFLKKKQNHM